MPINKNINFSMNGRPATEEDKKKIVNIITKLFSSLAAIFAVVAIVCCTLHYKNSTREYEIVEGTIIDFDQSRNRDSRRYIYAPIFTFEYLGESYTNRHSVHSSRYGGKNSKYQIGTVVDIIVYSGKPQKANINDTMSRNIALFIGVVFGFMAIIFFVVTRFIRKVELPHLQKS